ncbi:MULTISPECIES: DUF6753 family protein [unclassified Moorena]|uniref:DUF6753 family protein n=1 Tax=unclassified Moorena TaxID=2683338 RepID=UPI0013FFE15A|nr:MULTISPECIES: DUF6753 family protein [unclassified Moorena]NEO10950.1 hypothetical protein [Moorena sp. SIO3E8]NEP99064.1 hypothetical protein [Moorena sp. SIO3F7]
MAIYKEVSKQGIREMVGSNLSQENLSHIKQPESLSDLIDERDKTDYSLLEKLLEGRSDSFKAKILDLVVATELDANDPLFLFLVATSSLETMLADTPKSLEQLFRSWEKDIQQMIDVVGQSTMDIQRQEISKAIALQSAPKANASAIEQSKVTIESKSERQPCSYPPKGSRDFLVAKTSPFINITAICGAVVLSLVCGLGAGWGLSQLSQPKLDPNGSRQLTLDEADTLNWAISKEGKLARNITKWNAGYLDNLECQKDAIEAGIRLNFGGKKATSGYCLLWVAPPSQRKYIDNE